MFLLISIFYFRIVLSPFLAMPALGLKPRIL